MFQPCFLAVEMKLGMVEKSFAPCSDRKPPEIFCLSRCARPARRQSRRARRGWRGSVGVFLARLNDVGEGRGRYGAAWRPGAWPALGRCGAERGLGLVKADALGRDGVPTIVGGLRRGSVAAPRPAPGRGLPRGRHGGAAFASCAPSLPSISISGLQLSKVMGVAQRMVQPCIVKYGVRVVVRRRATPEQAAAPGRDPVEGQPGTRGDVQPLGPPADPQAGLVHVLDRRRFHQVGITSTIAFEAPGAASSHPRDGRRNQGDGDSDPPSNSARRSSGKSW